MKTNQLSRAWPQKLAQLRDVVLGLQAGTQRGTSELLHGDSALATSACSTGSRSLRMKFMNVPDSQTPSGRCCVPGPVPVVSA